MKKSTKHNLSSHSKQVKKTNWVALGVSSVGLLCGTFLISGQQAHASEADGIWTPNSVATIKARLEDGKNFKIVWGDYLEGIAEASGISVQRLQEINKIENANLIFAGRSIIVSGTGEEKTVTAVDTNNNVTGVYNASDNKPAVNQNSQDKVGKPAETTSNKPAGTAKPKPTTPNKPNPAPSKPETPSNPETPETPEADVTGKIALEIAITDAESRLESDYSPEAWTVFAAELAKAKAIFADPNATQVQINLAKAELRKVLNTLDVAVEDEGNGSESTPGVAAKNKTALRIAITEANTRVEANYTAESWAIFTAELAKAKAVLADTNATQVDVNFAKANLRIAMNTLVLKSPETNVPNKPETPENSGKPETTYVNKIGLEIAIYDANNLLQANYTAESWAVMTTALQNANSVNANANATQVEVNLAKANLRSAMGKLIRVQAGKPSTPSTPEASAPEVSETPAENTVINKQSLQLAIADAGLLVQANYTAESWAMFQTELQNAKATNSNSNVTQVQVNLAKAALRSAMGLLVLV